MIRLLLLLALAGLALGCGRPPDAPSTVYLLGAFPDSGAGTDAVPVTAALTATGRGDVVLFDSPSTRGRLPQLVRELHAQRVVAVGRFDVDALTGLDVPIEGPFTWPTGGPPVPVWERALSGQTIPKVVVCSADRVVDGARVAGLARVPLCPVGDVDRDGPIVGEWLERWRTREIVLIGDVRVMWPNVRVVTGSGN